MDITNVLFSPKASPSTQSVDLTSNTQSESFIISQNDPMELEKCPYDDDKFDGIVLPSNGNALPDNQIKMSVFREILKDKVAITVDSNNLNHSDKMEKYELLIGDEIEKPLFDINEFLYSELNQSSNNPVYTNLMQIENPSTWITEDKLSLSNEQVKLIQQRSDKNQSTVITSAELSQNMTTNENSNNVEFAFKQVIDERTDNTDSFNDHKNDKGAFEVPQEMTRTKEQHEADILKELNSSFLANKSEIFDKNVENSSKFNSIEQDGNKGQSNIADEPFITASPLSNATEISQKYSSTSQLNGESVISRETFDEDLTQKIQLMINSKENSATVNIDPPELGQIEIKVVQEAGKTHIVFLANLEQTQELIESNLSKLRTQMESQGLDLGNVSVFNGHSDNQHSQLAKQNQPKREFVYDNDNTSDFHEVKVGPSLGTLNLYA